MLIHLWSEQAGDWSSHFPMAADEPPGGGRQGGLGKAARCGRQEPWLCCIWPSWSAGPPPAQTLGLLRYEVGGLGQAWMILCADQPRDLGNWLASFFIHLVFSFSSQHVVWCLAPFPLDLESACVWAGPRNLQCLLLPPPKWELMFIEGG